MNLWQYLLLAGTGCAAGFIDAVAGGGGLLTIPVLLYVGLPEQVALGTNKLQSSCGTSVAVWRYSRGGLIAWGSIWPAVVMSFVAASIGALAVAHLDKAVLEKVIPALLTAAALYTILQPRVGDEPREPRLDMIYFAVIVGGALGFYDGFFGPGAGMFWTLACMLLRGMDMRSATGATKAANLASNLAALSMFAAAGCLDLRIGAAMIAGQLLGARLGSGMVIRHGAKLIRPIFAAASLCLAGGLLWRALHPKAPKAEPAQPARAFYGAGEKVSVVNDSDGARNSSAPSTALSAGSVL